MRCEWNDRPNVDSAHIGIFSEYGGFRKFSIKPSKLSSRALLCGEPLGGFNEQESHFVENDDFVHSSAPLFAALQNRF
jgi:hypothetical protein